MLSQLIWWSSILLEVLVLVRGLQTKLALRYPLFYGYVAFVLFFEDLASYLIGHFIPGLYHYSYWVTEFVGLIIGCGVVFEIYRMGLQRFPGTARMARNALALVFALAVAKGILSASSHSQWWLAADTMSVERILRIVQAVAVLALAVAFLLYA